MELLGIFFSFFLSFFEEYLSCSFNEVSQWNRKER